MTSSITRLMTLPAPAVGFINVLKNQAYDVSSFMFHDNKLYKVTCNLLKDESSIIGRTTGISENHNIIKKTTEIASKYKDICTVDAPEVTMIRHTKLNNIIYTEWYDSNSIHVESHL